MAIRWDHMGHHSEMNTHTCLFNHERLVDYVSGNCTPEERLAAERHLAHCPECRREILELEKTWWALDVWQEEKTPPAPRLNDLRLRLASQAEKRGAWRLIQDAMGCRLALLRFRLSSIHFSPATTIASLAFGILTAAYGLILAQFQQPGFTIAPAVAWVPRPRSRFRIPSRRKVRPRSSYAPSTTGPDQAVSPPRVPGKET